MNDPILSIRGLRKSYASGTEALRRQEIDGAVDVVGRFHRRGGQAVGLARGVHPLGRRHLERPPLAVVVAARDGDAFVGAATALPMAETTAEERAPFEAAGWAVDRICYFGESVLLPRYRGQGAGVRFFAEREDPYKVDQIDFLAGEGESSVSLYRDREFVDLLLLTLEHGIEVVEMACELAARPLGSRRLGT